MTTSPNTMPAVNVLVSQIALMVAAFKGNRSMRLGTTASIAETVPSVGSEDKYVESSTAPRTQPIDFIAVAKMVCAIIV
jgi:hypothetical protein